MCDLLYIRMEMLLSGADHHSVLQLPLNCSCDFESMTKFQAGLVSCLEASPTQFVFRMGNPPVEGH